VISDRIDPFLANTADKLKYYYKLIASSKIPINKIHDLYTKKTIWVRIMGHVGKQRKRTVWHEMLPFTAWQDIIIRYFH